FAVRPSIPYCSLSQPCFRGVDDGVRASFPCRRSAPGPTAPEGSMKIVGSAVVGAERPRVWAALQDPAVLVATIPGCERLEATGQDTYKMTVTAGVASIKGIYQGEVALTDPDEPERFVLKARGQGTPGTVDATVEVRLSEVDGGTRIDYDAEAVVGGMVG